MSRFRHESREQRQARFEQFEQRLVMSAQGVAPLLPELELAAPAITQQVVVQPQNQGTSPTTAAAQIAAEYGFDGHGQTVAVIDSGIAWDHHALGGGFGAGHRVVGGWDFAENNANPYDSGPAGHHGTHVAGIIASDHDRFRGVSSGVDLVSLRVFNDQGQGSLDWVKQALQWVGQNQNSFENPITTVVMSLGTQWNGFTKPAWANLETEFANLRSQGIFISVAAGNSFQQYNQPGLSYPAVSEHVVPVGSHNASGNISDFSQRAGHALFAPGESIASTVPNHLFGGMAQNRFMGLTGTSMAAPFVAGASAILRQANEFMGHQNITQDTLYQQLRATADRVFDPLTNAFYSRVNLQNALAHVIPDLHGNTPDLATQIGVLNGDEQIIGTIGRLDDIDYFSFQASRTGRVEFEIETTHQLEPNINVLGREVTVQGNRFSFDVQAGQEYTFSISTLAGNGHYTIQAHLHSGPPATDWGKITFLETNHTVAGESLFQLQAARNGQLTVEANFQPGQNLRMEIYDAQMNLIGSQTGSQGRLRFDSQASQGETFFVKAIGQSTSVDFCIVNQVSWGNGVIVVNGSQGDDQIAIRVDQDFAITVNGIDYQIQADSIHTVRVFGNGGNDRFELQLGAQNDTVATFSDRMFVRNDDFRLSAHGFAEVSVDGGAGHNTIRIEGTGRSDRFFSDTFTSTLTGPGYVTTVSSFNIVHAISSGGGSRAELVGTPGDDVVRSRLGRTSMFAEDRVVIADQFSATRIDAGGGNDRAFFFESRGDREFEVQGGFVAVRSQNHTTWGTGFRNIHLIANQGDTRIQFRDTTTNDIFRVDGNVASMVGSWYGNFAYGFKQLHATASNGGWNLAHIVDTAGNDSFVSGGNEARMVSQDRLVTTRGFDQVNAIGRNGGHNFASLAGTSGNDRLIAGPNSSHLVTSQNQVRRVVGFQQTEVNLGGGHNQVHFQGGQGHNLLKVNQHVSSLNSEGQSIRATNASETRFSGNGGFNQAVLQNVNLLEGLGNRATALIDQHRITAADLHQLEADSVDLAMAEYDLDIVDFQYLLRGGWKPK